MSIVAPITTTHRTRGRQAIVPGIQREWLIQSYGTSWLRSNIYPRSEATALKKQVLSVAVAKVVAKYGSEDPWRRLSEDVLEPEGSGGDASPDWTVYDDVREKAKAKIRADIRGVLRRYAREMEEE